MEKSVAFLLIFMLFYSCSEKNNPIYFSDAELSEFRELAWNDLSETEMQSASVSKYEIKFKYSRLYLDDDPWTFKINNKKYPCVRTNPFVDFKNDQKFVIAVVNTTDDLILGPIFILIEPNSKQIFGRGLRD